MSKNDDSENDIWEYRPLEKKKKRLKSPAATAPSTKRRCAPRKASKKDTPLSVKTAGGGDGRSVDGSLQTRETHSYPPPNGTVQTHTAAEGPNSGGFCPVCQMPFSVLVVQTQRWHVAECLDTSRDTCKECPDGLQCSSTIPNHYKKFDHTLLAQRRANGDTAPLGLSQQAETSGETNRGCLPGLLKDGAGGFLSETSQDSALSLSALSSCSASPHNNHTATPPPKFTNGLLLLRSPGPEDLKKKKGWLFSTKSQNSTPSASQESTAELSSTPMKTGSGAQVCEGSPNSESAPDNDDAISYSPLSEFPAETELKNNDCRKALFNNEVSENEAEHSMLLFSDGFSSEDELLTQFIENMDTDNVQVKEPTSFKTQVQSVTSLPPTNQQEAHSGAFISCKSSVQSPQSIVLERLRDTLLTSDSLHPENLNDGSLQSQRPHRTPPVLSSQTTAVQRSQTMLPEKGQSTAGQASCLKQTDIGVFFGLKPLKEKEKETGSGLKELHAAAAPTLGENPGQRRQRRDGQRKRKAEIVVAPPRGTVTADISTPALSAQGDARKGRTSGWRRRWNRSNADGEAALRRCPFYKKIPGTKFAIDAFQYGEIEGITGYFLTHFHSDHYGGLTKNFTCPIYCNRITGNLVRSILLDANHCPGAAMLLFFLPDGQTVLHTGDFRADPAMETYPELLGCRVQTLYLDTTYCSPEYTFPRQQEVISFAASTAFEEVTLNPRTLVVCGSYSVGKEKVFLALAEVLGSKVCLSRDKYNTMCCLESEEVRQRMTTDWKAAQVHVLPMMQLSFKKLQDHLSRFSARYDQLVAFKPTGWTFSQQVESVGDIQPQISGNISIYGIPYSEHSSFPELKRFVQWLQPLKIIPTVNNGSWASRKAMEKCFSEWLVETRAKL